MSEQLPRYYEINHPCPLANGGHCCLEKHKANVAAVADTKSETMTINSQDGITTLKLAFKPIGETRLHIYSQAQRWETSIGCDQNKVAEDMTTRRILSNSDQIDHILDITSEKLTVHTHTSHDCPLPNLLRQKKANP